MKLLRGHILIEQTFTPKDRKVILAGDVEDGEKYDIKSRVINVAEDVKSVKVGDEPLVTPHAQILANKIVEGNTKDDKSKKVFHQVMHEFDVVAILEEGDDAITDTL